MIVFDTPHLSKSPHVRKVVRQRDLCCRATNTSVVLHRRRLGGPDCVGFDVAHIFALGHTNDMVSPMYNGLYHTILIVHF